MSGDLSVGDALVREEPPASLAGGYIIEPYRPHLTGAHQLRDPLGALVAIATKPSDLVLLRDVILAGRAQ